MRLIPSTLVACAALLAVPIALGGCATKPKPVASAPPAAEVAEPTRVVDRAAADRLLNAKGVTLQWIGWSQRGPVNAWEKDGTIYLMGSQSDPAGPGRLFMDGRVEEIGADYFTFRGTIRITDTPDPGRKCEQDKLWHFAITQNRPYWRLREFEWCDYLTDYVDIYF